MLELSAPHNWCDRFCERCPLEPRCPIPRSTASLEENLARAAELLRKECEALGLDPDEPIELPKPTIEADLLRQAAQDYGAAAHELDPACGPIFGRGLRVAGKVARVALYADDADGDVWDADGIPNLLLIEKLLDENRAAARGPRAERLAEAERRLRALLAPLLATIGPEARALIDAFARAGLAPSPFAVRR